MQLACARAEVSHGRAINVHRVIDDSKGVITAIETTASFIPEGKKLTGLYQ